MAIHTLTRLDMDALRQAIALIGHFSEQRVIDGSVQTDTSGWYYVIKVSPLTSELIGTEVKFVGDQVQEIVTTTRETTVSICAFGGETYGLIEDLSTQFQTHIAQQLLKKLGVGIVKESAIKHATEDPVDGKPQQTQLDLTLSHIHRIESLLTSGESVIITTLKDPI